MKQDSQFQIHPQTGRISLASLESAADIDVAGFVAQGVFTSRKVGEKLL
jgi:hypothetical protein